MAALLFSSGDGCAFSTSIVMVLHCVHLYAQLDGAGPVVELPSEKADATEHESPA